MALITLETLGDGADPEFSEGIRRIGDTIRRLVSRLVSDYDSRIMGRVSKPPVSLLWLAVGVPSDQHPRRAAVASMLLDAADEPLHTTAKKIKHLFTFELELCVLQRCYFDCPLHTYASGGLPMEGQRFGDGVHNEPH